jgi:hypothetical protein
MQPFSLRFGTRRALGPAPDDPTEARRLAIGNGRNGRTTCHFGRSQRTTAWGRTSSFPGEGGKVRDRGRHRPFRPSGRRVFPLINRRLVHDDAAPSRAASGSAWLDPRRPRRPIPVLPAVSRARPDIRGGIRLRRDGDGRKALHLPNSRAATAWQEYDFAGQHCAMNFFSPIVFCFAVIGPITLTLMGAIFRNALLRT